MHRISGDLLSAELNYLVTYLTDESHIARPLIAIIGGSKISTKLPVISRLLTVCDTIILTGLLSFTVASALARSSFTQSELDTAAAEHRDPLFGATPIETAYFKEALDLVFRANSIGTKWSPFPRIKSDPSQTANIILPNDCLALIDESYYSDLTKFKPKRPKRLHYHLEDDKSRKPTVDDLIGNDQYIHETQRAGVDYAHRKTTETKPSLPEGMSLKDYLGKSAGKRFSGETDDGRVNKRFYDEVVVKRFLRETATAKSWSGLKSYVYII